MMGQQQMGGNIAPFNNQGVPPRNLRAAVGIRNFLVGTPANDKRFNFNERKAANDETLGDGGSVSYVPGMVPAMKKYDTAGAVDVNFREISKLRTTGEYPGVVLGDPVQIRETTGENPGIMIDNPVQIEEKAVNPERVKEALGKLEKVKTNRGGFLKGLRERMGVAQEKMEAVAAKVGKAIEAYNKLEPKTKLAIGLTLTAGSMIGVASGATFLAGGIGILRFAMKGASTVAMYQGLEGMLDKKYAELENVSETRKKFMKVGALAAAAFVNFGLTDALNNSGMTDKMVGALDKLGGMMSTAGTPMSEDTMVSVVTTTDGGTFIESTGNREVEPWSKNGPAEKDVYPLTKNQLSHSDGLSNGEEIVPSGQTTTVAPRGSIATVMSTPLATPSVLEPPTESFDTAPAAPTESMGVVGGDGTLAGYTLPDESFMALDRKITPENTVGVGAPTQAATVTPEIVTHNKFDVGVEESFINKEGAPIPTTTPEAVTPSTNMALEDGTPVQANSSTLDDTGRKESESTFTKEVPVKPDASFVEANAVLAESSATIQAPQTQISFAANPSLTPDDISKLSSFNQLASSDTFNSALTTAATDIDEAKRFFSFADGSGRIKESFLSVVQKNPSISVDSLLTADTSALSGKEGDTLREAQGVLRRMLPENVLAQSSVRGSSVVDILQNNFKA